MPNKKLVVNITINPALRRLVIAALVGGAAVVVAPAGPVYAAGVVLGLGLVLVSSLMQVKALLSKDDGRVQLRWWEKLAVAATLAVGVATAGYLILS